MAKPSFDKLKEDEYIVTALPNIDFPVYYAIEKGETHFISANLRELSLKTKVESYEKSTYHLLAVAQRIRNYSAFATCLRLPLNVKMDGRRKDNESWWPFPAVYDGSTGLPLTDGGIGGHSIYNSGFGPHEGMKPPFDARQTLEKLSSWTNRLNEQLQYAQLLLNEIDERSYLDVAIASIGGSIWEEVAAKKLTDRWRSIEAIAKKDYHLERAKWESIGNTIQNRSKKRLNRKTLERLRDSRNISVHDVPLPEETAEIFDFAEELYPICYWIAESALEETGLPSRPRVWSPP